MVSYASLDEAFGPTTLKPPPMLAANPSAQIPARAHHRSSPSPSEPSSSAARRAHRQGRREHKQRTLEEDAARRAFADAAKYRAHDPRQIYGGGGNNYAPFTPAPVDCEDYYRGCNVENVENIMDLYTSPGGLLDEETRAKNAEHRRRLRRSPQSALDRSAFPAYDPAVSLPAASGLESAPASSLANYAYPFAADGSADAIELPYRPFDDPGSLARNAAAAKYDVTHKGGAENDPVAWTGEEEVGVDDDAGDDFAVDMDRNARWRRDSAERHARMLRETSAAETPSVGSDANAASAEPPAASTAMGTWWTYALEVALYIITGILLIFVMEQLVQIGVHMGRARALAEMSRAVPNAAGLLPTTAASSSAFPTAAASAPFPGFAPVPNAFRHL